VNILKIITPKLTPLDSRCGSRAGSRLAKPGVRKPIKINPRKFDSCKIMPDD